jgi:hypothetical protein
MPGIEHRGAAARWGTIVNGWSGTTWTGIDGGRAGIEDGGPAGVRRRRIGRFWWLCRGGRAGLGESLKAGGLTPEFGEISRALLRLRSFQDGVQAEGHFDSLRSGFGDITGFDCLLEFLIKAIGVGGACRQHFWVWIGCIFGQTADKSFGLLAHRARARDVKAKIDEKIEDKVRGGLRLALEGPGGRVKEDELFVAEFLGHRVHGKNVKKTITRCHFQKWNSEVQSVKIRLSDFRIQQLPISDNRWVLIMDDFSSPTCHSETKRETLQILRTPCQEVS